MKTSNFKTDGHLPNAVAISQGVPRGWCGLRYLALAPSRALLRAARKPDGAAMRDPCGLKQKRARDMEESLALTPKGEFMLIGPTVRAQPPGVKT